MSDDQDASVDPSDDNVGGTETTGSTETTDGNLAASPDDAASTTAPGSTARRPTPAASAASRARRIGGVTGARKPGAEPAAGSAATESAATVPPAGDDEPVSTRKRTLRSTSARELKAEAESPRAPAEVPAWLRWVPALVLSICAIAMIVIVAVSAHGVWYAKPSTSRERDQVLAAAKKCTAVANTYNYKTLAADEKRGLACTTGAWTAQYKSALEKIVKPTATQLKATQTVQINAAGVESVTGNGHQWTTIVYGRLTINQSGATPRVDPFAAIVRMDKVKSTYLVSKIDLITDSSA